MGKDATAWAVDQITRLLGLDDESARQIVDYASSMPKDAAAEHLKNLLGDAPASLDFISSFNARRAAPVSADSTPHDSTPHGSTPHGFTPHGSTSHGSRPSAAAANNARRGAPTQSFTKAQARKGNKPPLNQLPPPRQPDNYGAISGAYFKQQEQTYVPGSSHQAPSRSSPGQSSTNAANTAASGLAGAPPSSSAASTRLEPMFANVPVRTATPSKRSAHKGSAAATSLGGSASGSPSRSGANSPRPGKHAAKVAISGGTPMHGASSTLSDVDAALRALETASQPTIESNVGGNESEKSIALRRCDCQATLHPLLEAAPNCLHCGKIICTKEGLRPCTFCHHRLLSADDAAAMIRALREERGQERMAANNASQGRARSQQAAALQAAFSQPHQNGARRDKAHQNGIHLNKPSGKDDPSARTQAEAHRDRLLGYQATNAKRTQVVDEAAAFDVPGSSATSLLWGSPVERARRLKEQQRQLRALEHANRPEAERRKKMVLSVDVVGGKVIKKYTYADDEPVEADDDAGLDPDSSGNVNDLGNPRSTAESQGSGAFSRNPLLGALVRPVWRPSSSPSPGNGGRSKDNQAKPLEHVSGEGTDLGVANDAGTELDHVNGERSTHNQANGSEKGKHIPNDMSSTASDPMTTARRRPPASTWRRVQDDMDDNEAWILDGGVYGSSTGDSA